MLIPEKRTNRFDEDLEWADVIALTGSVLNKSNFLLLFFLIAHSNDDLCQRFLEQTTNDKS